MAGYDSGELFWTPPRQRPGDGCCSLMGRLGWRGGGWTPRTPSTPQAASASQLRELIRRAFHGDTGHWPVSVTLAVVRYKQRFRFQVVTY